MFKRSIVFESELEGVIESPKPSLYYIPEAYKKLDKLQKGAVKGNLETVKACVPFLDALKFGYIIPFPIDYEVVYHEGSIHFNISEMIEGGPAQNLFSVESHSNAQISDDLKHDKRTFDIVLKFLNPWQITTPPGYSCLFTQPLNQNAPFKIIDGVVDTDNFPLKVNFPFYWTGDLNKKHILKHGTPMVQVIPFKRDDWKMEVKRSFEDYNDNVRKKIKIGNRFLDHYKKLFWSKKTYR